ncbi:MAG TPA: hypothetical protein VOB72_04775 [Candidatus Dormibacteraeota bacterium]|nr:hypothetical protein [Candidatus Dormibacteraeota bacterium]
MTAAARKTREAGVIVEMDDLRQRDTDQRRMSRELGAVLAAAMVTAFPALLQAADVVSGSGPWECQEPIPRVGRRGSVEEFERCERCFACRMDAAQQALAEVEL